VIYAAHERIIRTPESLEIPAHQLGNRESVDKWLEQNRDEFDTLSEMRRQAAVEKLETVIRRNMSELVDGLCKDADALPCEIAETISVQRIASREKSKTARDIMETAPTVGVDQNIAQAAKLLVNSTVPIVNILSEKGKLIGIVTSWDIASAMASDMTADTPLTKIMTADVVTCTPEATIIDCIRTLENHAISAMPVVESDRAVGVITSDVLTRKTLLKLLQADV
jgi:glutamate dehydrogenase (NAD(P)+)